MGSVEVGGVSLKTWVWSELGLEKGGWPEGKVWRVKQASKRGDGRGESGSTAAWGCWGEARAGRGGEQPRGGQWGQVSPQGGQKGPEWGPGHAATPDSGTGRNSLKVPCNPHPELAGHVPLPWAVARLWPR